jgi:DNA-binding response OmpR family regulator
MCVLIVEDDEDLRSSLEEMLVQAGLEVDSAADALSALEKIDGAGLLLTGIGLSGMDGLELCSRARSRRPDLGVIVMTAHDSPEKRSEARRRGAGAFLAKPFRREELLDRIDLLSGREERKSRSSRPVADRPEPAPENPVRLGGRLDQ